MHTYDSEATLEKALSSVKWVDELIVVDMESCDATLDIAQRFTDRIYSTPRVQRIDGIRNTYIDKAVNPWIVVLDSDEYLANDSEETIKELVAQYGDHYDAFAIPRYNNIAGQVMRGSGWYPDHQVRLFRKGTVIWKDTIHVLPEVRSGEHKVMKLNPPNCLHIHHNNYRDISHFIEKQVSYALNDQYDPNPEAFDFSQYIARAYEQLAKRTDTDNDGNISRALAIIMAWDSMMRGIIHWDRLSERPPLEDACALPVVTSNLPYRSSIGTLSELTYGRKDLLPVEERLLRLETIENSLSWKVLQRFLAFFDKVLFPWHSRRRRFFLNIIYSLQKGFLKKKTLLRE
jgi:glycosyltransferase involved in cell wall biosynthesis